MQYSQVRGFIKQAIARIDKVKKYVWHMSPDIYWQLSFDRMFVTNEEGQIVMSGFPVTTIPGKKHYIELKEKSLE